MFGKDRLKANAKVAKSAAEDFAADERAQAGEARTVVSLVVALMVGAIVAAFLLPIGVEEIVDVNTSNWSGAAQSLWGVLDIIIIFALFLFFVSIALGASNRV